MRQQKILHIDLSTGEVETELVPREVERQFIGGRGISAYYFYQMTKPGIDPLGPENPIIVGTGALTGTTAPCSGRTSITCKGPATGRYLKTSVGGHWGAEIKFAGYDYLMITGCAPKPVYIWIDDAKVEIRDASALWGHDTVETNRRLKDEIGDEDIQSACIGPAGENRVMCACVIASYHNAAGRGGSGAVMGSKNLKAIAVRGSGGVTVDNPRAFYEISQRVRRELASDSGTILLADFGTSGSVPVANEVHALNNRNFQQDHVDYADKLSGQYLIEGGYLKGRVACHSCSTGCHRFVKTSAGKYAGVEAAGPELEAMIALGSGVDVSDTAAIIAANDVCNKMGMDAISAGVYLQWAMESFERGLLTKDDTGGIDLSFGNAGAMIAILEKVAKREGKIGQLLADGVKRAAEKLGGESWKWAVQAKGLEQSGVETRSAKGYSLALAVNPRGPDHLMTETFAELGASTEAVDLVARLTGDPKLAVPYTTEKRAEIVVWHEDCYALTEILGICVFTSTAAFAVTPENMTEMYNAAVGGSLSAEQAMEVGRRIVTLERMFNVREGATREEDKLPWRMMNEPIKTGPRAGFMNSTEELGSLLDRYYSLHGWDLQTGIPTQKTLEGLGLAGLTADVV